MHPDPGTIIGISLAGAILIVAIVFLCILRLCYKEDFKPRRHRTSRPSTSSRNAFANLGFFGSSRNIEILSPANLQHFHNPRHLQNVNNNGQAVSVAPGILNPVWQLHCHSCGALAATSGLAPPCQCRLHSSQVSVSGSNPCLFCFHDVDIRNTNPNDYDSETHERMASNDLSQPTRFQFFNPQLISPPSESPPPYPGLNVQTDTGNSETLSVNHHLRDIDDTTINPSAPPSHSPKFC